MTRTLLAVSLLGAVAAGAGPAPPSPQPAIAFAADQAPAVTGEIYRLGLDGRRVDLSRSPFQDTEPAVSPDGRLVAFLGGRTDGVSVFVVPARGGTARPVSAPLGYRPEAGEAQLAWAPDGRRLAVTVDRGTAASLLLVGLDGRQRVLARSPVLLEPAWSPDGRLVTASIRGGTRAFAVAGGRGWFAPGSGSAAGWSPQGLFAAAATGGRIRVYDARGRVAFAVAATRAAWSRDGLLLALAGSHRVEVRAADGRRVFTKTIPSVDAEQGALAWDGEGRVVVWTPSRGPLAVDLRTGRVTRTSDAVFFGSVRSRDGRLVATTARSGAGFAIRVHGAGGTRTVGRVPGCFDDGVFGAAIASLQFTPDGRSLVYQSNCLEPFANLWTVAPDGTQLRRLTTRQEQEADPAWSPDGTRVAFTWSQRTGLSCKGCAVEIHVGNDDGSALYALTRADDGEFDTNASWSPDGRSILFEHSTPSSLDLWSVDAGGGPPHDLGIDGEWPAWGPTRIAYVRSTVPASLWTAAPDGSSPEQVASGSVYAPAWSRDGRLAWLEQSNGGGPRIVVDGRPVVLRGFLAVRSLAWSPDGTRLAVAARAKGTATFDVYTLAPDGSGVARLTHDVDAEGVSWRG